MTRDEKPHQRRWRDAFSGALAWFAVVGFMLTLPLSFPALVLFNKVRGKKFHGKGKGLLFLAWIGTTALLILLVAAYLKKGFAGLQTLFWIGVAGTIWAFVVFVTIRILLEIILLLLRIGGWFKKRFKK